MSIGLAVGAKNYERWPIHSKFNYTIRNFFFKTHYFVLGTEGGWAVLALEDMSALQTLRCKYLTKKLLSIFGPTHEKLILYEIFVFVMKICKDVANKFQGKIINFRMYEFQGEGSSDGKI